MNAEPATLAIKMFHPNVIKVVAIALAIVFGVMYVAQMNSASMKGYAMRDLENDGRSLTQENDRLHGEVDRLRSLASIHEREAFLGMVPVDHVEYVAATGTNVALK